MRAGERARFRFSISENLDSMHDGSPGVSMTEEEHARERGKREALLGYSAPGR